MKNGRYSTTVHTNWKYINTAILCNSFNFLFNIELYCMRSLRIYNWNRKNNKYIFVYPFIDNALLKAMKSPISFYLQASFSLKQKECTESRNQILPFTVCRCSHFKNTLALQVTVVTKIYTLGNFLNNPEY